MKRGICPILLCMALGVLAAVVSGGSIERDCTDASTTIAPVTIHPDHLEGWERYCEDLPGQETQANCYIRCGSGSASAYCQDCCDDPASCPCTGEGEPDQQTYSPNPKVDGAPTAGIWGW